MIAFCIAMYVFRKGHILARLTFAFIIGGALGNFYDRLFLSGVRDFIQIVYLGLDLGSLLNGTSFYIFNIADAALTAGVVMFAVYFVFMYKPELKEIAGPMQPVADTEDEENVDEEKNVDEENVAKEANSDEEKNVDEKKSDGNLTIDDEKKDDI